MMAQVRADRVGSFLRPPELLEAQEHREWPCAPARPLLADLPEEQGRGLERAVSRQTVPQRFTYDFVSAVPSNVRVFHDFEFSTLLNTQAGQFYNIFAGIDANGSTNTLNQRAGTLCRDTLKEPSIFLGDMWWPARSICANTLQATAHSTCSTSLIV